MISEVFSNLFDSMVSFPTAGVRTRFSRHGGVQWTVGLDDLRGLFQP